MTFFQTFPITHPLLGSLAKVIALLSGPAFPLIPTTYASMQHSKLCLLIASLTSNHPVPTLPQPPTPTDVNSYHNHILLYSSQILTSRISFSNYQLLISRSHPLGYSLLKPHEIAQSTDLLVSQSSTEESHILTSIFGQKL